MRMWDARTAECLRSIPGGGAALRAMLPIWSPDGNETKRAGGAANTNASAERCRVWSADAERTLCVWEPRRAPAQQQQKSEAASAPLTVTLNADVSDLAVSTDGTLVCAVAGRDGVLILDGNARLRSRLNANAAAMDSITAVHIVGRGRQLWTAAGEGGVALWERDGGLHDLSWSYHCVRRLASPPLLALRPAAGSQVWGALADYVRGEE